MKRSLAMLCVKSPSRRTNPSFVYRTPTVRFAEILKPRLEYGQPIDIAKLRRSRVRTLTRGEDRAAAERR